MPDLRLAAVLLAAGASTRLGQPKQLIQMDGESLLRRTARLAVEAGCSPVIVVLGSEAARMQPQLNGLHAHAIVHQAWPEGMGSSLRAGVEALLARPGSPPQALLLLVCDQPRLTLDHLHSLLRRHTDSGAPITASAYASRTGVPAVFSAAMLPQLLTLHGDRGARDLIRQAGDTVATVPWPDGVLDLDRPEDLLRI